MELAPPELSPAQRGAWLVGLAGMLIALVSQLAGAARLVSRETAGLIAAIACLCAAFVCGLTWAVSGRSWGPPHQLLWLASFAWAFAGIALVPLLHGGWWTLLYLLAAAPIVAYASAMGRRRSANEDVRRPPTGHRYRKRR